MSFKDRLKTLRNAKHLTQEQLSKETGIKKSSIGMYESGKREPKFETMEVFADYFNVPLDYLLGRETKIFISPAECKHIKKYRALTDAHKKAVDCLIDSLYEADRQDFVKKESQKSGAV